MTDYKATFEQWNDVEQWTKANPHASRDHCILELLSRVESLEEETRQENICNNRCIQIIAERFDKLEKTIDDNYKQFLLQFKEDEYPNINDLPYRRVWTKPINTYASNYRLFDVSLAPIKNHIFNRVKSQLKVIEAGFYKKAIIASNVGPYTIDLKHALNNGEFTDGNALLVNEVKNHSDWAKYMKKLIDNPNWSYDLGQRLYETVKDTYDLNKVTKDRSELYKSLLK